MAEENRKVFQLSIEKVVVIGPESTGKSTLSEDLAQALDTVFVPEFARDYLINLGRPYSETDMLTIAKGQLESEAYQCDRAKDVLICDTDLNVIKVWAEHSYNRCDRWILEQIAEKKYDLYLLTGIDLQWEDDMLREHPEEHMRLYFYSQYRDIVINSGIPWVAVNGDRQTRLDTALRAIEDLLRKK